MSDAAVKALEQVMGLSAEDRRWVAERIDANEFETDETFTMADVPQEIIDDELAEVEARMAADELDPQPRLTADEAIDRILARRASRRATP